VTWRFYASYGFGRSAIMLSLLVDGWWGTRLSGPTRTLTF
jgi:hypothetical protein